MAWVGIDRGLGSSAQRDGDDPNWLNDLDQLRTRIHAEVCSEGYSEGLGTFVQTYDLKRSMPVCSCSLSSGFCRSTILEYLARFQQSNAK